MMEREPGIPRRVFVAAALAALTAGGAATLVTLGAATAPEKATFRFARGTALAPGEAERLRGLLSRALEDDRIAVRIIGHTGTQGDPAANLVLSEARASSLRDIAMGMNIDAARVDATGVGGGAPLPKPAEESARAHEAALSRADVILQVRR